LASSLGVDRARGTRPRLPNRTTTTLPAATRSLSCCRRHSCRRRRLGRDLQIPQRRKDRVHTLDSGRGSAALVFLFHLAWLGGPVCARHRLARSGRGSDRPPSQTDCGGVHPRCRGRRCDRASRLSHSSQLPRLRARRTRPAVGNTVLAELDAPAARLGRPDGAGNRLTRARYSGQRARSSSPHQPIAAAPFSIRGHSGTLAQASGLGLDSGRAV
jgi:hypothetical protein